MSATTYSFLIAPACEGVRDDIKLFSHPRMHEHPLWCELLHYCTACQYVSVRDDVKLHINQSPRGASSGTTKNCSHKFAIISHATIQFSTAALSYQQCTRLAQSPHFWKMIIFDDRMLCEGIKGEAQIIRDDAKLLNHTHVPLECSVMTWSYRLQIKTQNSREDGEQFSRHCALPGQTWKFLRQL